MNVFDLRQVIHSEITFCEGFTCKEYRPYGVLYYNPANPLSHDSNHAHIFRLDTDLPAAIREIIQFYQAHCLTPRLYPSFLENELSLLQPHLAASGFSLRRYQNTFMRYPPGVQPPFLPDEPAIRFQRVDQVTPEIVDLVRSEDDGDWTINVLKAHLLDHRFHLLSLWIGAACVSIASVKILENCSRVDDVLTHAAWRGRGFGSRLLAALVRYHQERSTNLLYLWTDNPIAVRMYARAGFVEEAFPYPWWGAWLPGD